MPGSSNVHPTASRCLGCETPVSAGAKRCRVCACKARAKNETSCVTCGTAPKTPGRSTCKPCRRIYQAEWFKKLYRSDPAFRERIKAANRKACTTPRWRDWYYRNRFGISLEAFNALWLAQGEKCALCGTGNLKGRELAVDHDHSTGKVRGILCKLCNTAVGLLKDDASLMRRAADYVEVHRGV